MGTEISLPAGFGAVSSLLAGQSKPGVNDELGAGVSSSYGIVGYKGKVWSIRFGGENKPLMRPDGDGPRNSIEVVLVKASPAISKIFYKNGYVDGSNAAPDCWSADGIKPDASVQNKCHSACADCPMNAWGSRVTEAGKQGKACSDSRRVAVVPAEDIENDLFGGPMLLRIPAASLKDLKAYGDLLNSYQYPYYGAVTRVAFDPQEAYPKFVFSAVRPLNDQEAAKILLLRDDKRVSTVLSEAQGVGAGAGGDAPAAQAVKSSPFEQDAPAPTLSQQAKATGPAASVATQTAPVQETTTAASPAATAAPTPTEDPKVAAKAALLAQLKALEEVGDAIIVDETPQADPEVTPEGKPPASFDDMLDKLLQ